ncbi:MULTISPECIES: hypothetical protein [unclassified Duganella]|uniref:hypothetical protein n=1 Tax=unclassified Duganella TaxID=2636909 RepID=UPI0006F5C77E|nr:MULTISPECIES: hypothetical protein [unclassified Duganella]KQV43035.1 hypothetical protein ASD07_21605 [Duganella sp. Root336D2]KRB97163.1 hypothetical protein ASE26_03790 [Duganella sp. Root198D2]
MNLIIRCLPLLGALCLAACGGGGGPSSRTLAAAPVVADGPMAFEQLANLGHSALQNPETFVVRDNDSLEKLWSRAYQNTTTAPAVPTVDFSRKMVLAVTPGYVAACTSFAIEKVTMSGGVMLVNYKTTPPLPTMMCIAAVFSPVSIIVVDRLDTTVKFIGS